MTQQSKEEHDHGQAEGYSLESFEDWLQQQNVDFPQLSKYQIGFPITLLILSSIGLPLILNDTRRSETEIFIGYGAVTQNRVRQMQ